MTHIETPDYDIDHESYSERGESSVTATWPVEIVERISLDYDDRYDADTKRYGDSYTEVAHEGEYREFRRLGNSLVNIDAYLSPDATIAVDAPETWALEGPRRRSWHQKEAGHREAHRLGTCTLDFDLYEAELVEAAKQRAAEDATHHIRVLAEWFCRAAPAGDDTLYGKWAISPFRDALLSEAEKKLHIDWALCFGGDPDEWRHDEPPVGSYGADDDTLQQKGTVSNETALYLNGGFSAVKENREENAAEVEN